MRGVYAIYFTLEHPVKTPAFWVVALVIAMIPALIVWFVVKKTETENNLREYRNHLQKSSKESQAEGSPPHIFAKAPWLLLLLIAIVSGLTAWVGISSLIDGPQDSSGIKAAGWGLFIFAISTFALRIKYREIEAAKLHAKAQNQT